MEQDLKREASSALVGAAERLGVDPFRLARFLSDGRLADVLSKLRISADLGRHIEWLRQDIELGFDAIYLHPVGPDPRAFLETFGERVLPVLIG